ncbi:MAG: hypothetical protein NC238_15690 [Dehalobacter sp.]|nr:hypothetical protein [Dehalobacter sp.]
MITATKFKIFEKYNGDGDGFVRTGTKSEKECLDYNDWLIIDSMIQDLQLVKNGLSSKTLENKINQKLHDEFDSEARELIQKRL